MDFMNRGTRPPVQQNAHGAEAGLGAPHPGHKNSRFKGPKGDWSKWSYIAFIVIVTLMLVAVIFSIALAKDVSSKESEKVAKDQFQAVFLNGGQVYFGKIDDLNSRYLSMNNIYYLRVNQQVQPDQQQAANANDISLVKLGCELHGPQDSMVINREQIIFWENLKADGQVAKAVAEYVKANPDGQKCDEQNNTSSGSEETTPAANTNTNTTKTPTTGR